MDGYDIISKLSTVMTGEDFLDTMLKQEDNNTYTFSINNNFNINCPEPMNLLSCDKNCTECWKNTLKRYGYKFLDDSECESCHVINLFKKFSFQEMMDKLMEDNELVFYSGKNIYFLKNNKLKCSEYSIDNVLDLTPYAKDAELTIDLLEKTFYETNIIVSKIVSEIEHCDVKKYLELGHSLIFVAGNRAWNIWKEENRLRYYSEDVDYEDSEGIEILAHDMLTSLFSGQWFMEDEIEY